MKKAIVLILFLNILFAKDYTKDIVMPNMSFPIVVDKDIIVMQRNCQWCHSYGYILNLGKQDKKFWTHIVHKMRDTFKAPITKKDEKIIINYLMRYYGKE
jgi:hypothetical protein